MALIDKAFYINFGNGSSTGYYAVTPWPTLTTEVVGNIIRQNAAPSVGNERCFICVASTGGTGATGASEPTWTVTRGALNTDATVTWQEATGIAALNGDLVNTPNWAAIKNTAVTLGQVIQNGAGTLLLIATTAGTAGNGSEPTWAAYTTAGATTSDNTVTWTTLGAPSSFTIWKAPHARCANAFASGWGLAGTTTQYFASSIHAETQSSALTAIVPSTAAVKAFVYCVLQSPATTPPGSADLTTGASVSTTGLTQLSFVGTNFYCYGFLFSGTSGSQTSATQCYFGASGAGQRAVLDNCAFQLGATGTGASQIRSGGGTIWNNCTVQFGGVSQEIPVGGVPGLLTWRNTPSAIIGTPPNQLIGFTSSGEAMVIDGVDLSAITGNIATGAGSSANTLLVTRCKINASATLAGNIGYQNQIDFIQCDSGATNYTQARYWYEGTLTQSIAVYRQGGASDGTTPLSWDIVTTANSTWTFPFQSFSIAEWNTLTGVTRTCTVYGVVNAAAVPNNDQMWMEVEYLGSASSPLASFANNTKANNLATGSALTADSTSNWAAGLTARGNSTAYTTASPPIFVSSNPNRPFFCISNGTSSGSLPGGYASAVDGGTVTDGTATFRAGCRFSMTVTLTAQMVGYLNATIKAAEASTTFYVDPLLNLS